MVRFFNDIGFDVTAIKGLRCPTAIAIANVSQDELRNALIEVNKDADALVQVRTNLSMVGLADEAERWLGKPVIAINAATWWMAMRDNGFPSNSTIGVLGLYDPATNIGLKEHKEDFGQTLGRWGIKPGAYIFQVSYLGYTSYNEDIPLDDQNYERNLNTITLFPESTNLKEVIVTSDRVPISINRDTIEYHADAFKTQENLAVEDLLKKLPGLEVEDDGTIKAKGKTVQRVLVDGKEFFGEDPQIATKNLPAKAVKKVQVYDKKSEMSEFTGIDDGERETTVNLTLKDTHKKGQIWEYNYRVWEFRKISIRNKF